MPRRPPPRYFYSRLTLYGLVLLILGWIAVSMILSISVAVFWEYERGAVLPKVALVKVNTPKTALQATEGLVIFNRELLVNVKRFLNHYRQDPEQTVEVWNAWRAEWRQDLLTFGHRYSFTQARADQSADETQLNDTYQSLLKLEEAYAETFEEVYRIHESSHERLSEKLSTLKATLNARLAPE